MTPEPSMEVRFARLVPIGDFVEAAIAVAVTGFSAAL